MSKKSLPKADVRYEVITQHDQESDDLLIPIPPQLLEELGWREGQTVNLSMDEMGRWILKGE